MWTAADIEIDITDLTDHPVVTARIRTPGGDLLLMANLEVLDRELVLERLHIQGENVRANQLGWAPAASDRDGGGGDDRCRYRCG